uniref:Uncharacterized protein n=1 Tax=Lepeophtheirus salmonis TaxID=72036 RepID=A0A0K2V6D8_LEPSM
MLVNIAFWQIFTASSNEGQSFITTIGLFPPSSRDILFKFESFPELEISFPTSVEPVNAILSTSKFLTKAAPV